MQIVAALVWPALAFVFAVVFAGLWQADRARAHLAGFAAGFFALFLAMSVHIAIPSLSPVISIPPLHGLACLSVIAIVWGAAKRLGQKIPLTAILTLSAVSCVALFYALHSSEHSLALLIQNGTSGLLFGIGAVILWTTRSTDLLDRFLVTTISLLAVFSLFRPFVVLALHVDLAPLIERELEVAAVNVVIMTLLTAMLGGVLVAIAIKEALDIRHSSARIDPISGFLDLRTFEQNGGQALANAQRLNMPASVAIVEFDRFDSLQNNWGHDTVDRIMREICDLVRSSQRESDIIGRIGEHRLAILFVGVGAQSALSIIQHLRKDIDHKLNDCMRGGLRFTLSASIRQSEQHKNLPSLLSATMQPLGPKQNLGPGTTFVNGVHIRPYPLGKPGDENFIALG
ncbi:GGDEF domain-containing protein [Erythrobacter sp. SCSIO 43205]|uniref:GGDEF domain-containing protein n=1 Tax=Erythrobacter sp. SCSIO 43205 TaxID=2779361 RepID=UPI001CA9E58E|nr:GGDEF domain-containing protein [Erythrobacter sp. SCSIO 43205]UAB77673.1 GGDEF domain-containing protein [Erythrobacter sp. SCSIO 43205]